MEIEEKCFPYKSVKKRKKKGKNKNLKKIKAIVKCSLQTCNQVSVLTNLRCHLQGNCCDSHSCRDYYFKKKFESFCFPSMFLFSFIVLFFLAMFQSILKSLSLYLSLSHYIYIFFFGFIEILLAYLKHALFCFS